MWLDFLLSGCDESASADKGIYWNFYCYYYFKSLHSFESLKVWLCTFIDFCPFTLQVEKMKIEEKRRLEEEDVIRLMREKDHYEVEMSLLKQELELTKKTYEQDCLELENQATETKSQLGNKIMELESLLTDSRMKVKELEAFTESKYLRWRKKEHGYKRFIDSHFGSLQVCIKLICV